MTGSRPLRRHGAPLQGSVARPQALRHQFRCILGRCPVPSGAGRLPGRRRPPVFHRICHKVKIEGIISSDSCSVGCKTDSYGFAFRIFCHFYQCLWTMFNLPSRQGAIRTILKGIICRVPFVHKGTYMWTTNPSVKVDSQPFEDQTSGR